jgi:hypothetical protein
MADDDPDEGLDAAAVAAARLVVEGMNALSSSQLVALMTTAASLLAVREGREVALRTLGDLTVLLCRDPAQP